MNTTTGRSEVKGEVAAVDIMIVILAGLIPITAASLYSLVGRTTSTADASQSARKRPDTGKNTIPEQGLERGAAAADESRRDAQPDTAENDHPTEQEQHPSDGSAGLDSLTAVTIHHAEAPSATPEPEAAR